jgi:hypothetical protein
MPTKQDEKNKAAGSPIANTIMFRTKGPETILIPLGVDENGEVQNIEFDPHFEGEDQLTPAYHYKQFELNTLMPKGLKTNMINPETGKRFSSEELGNLTIVEYIKLDSLFIAKIIFIDETYAKLARTAALDAEIKVREDKLKAMDATEKETVEKMKSK